MSFCVCIYPHSLSNVHLPVLNPLCPHVHPFLSLVAGSLDHPITRSLTRSLTLLRSDFIEHVRAFRSHFPSGMPTPTCRSTKLQNGVEANGARRARTSTLSTSACSRSWTILTVMTLLTAKTASARPVARLAPKHMTRRNVILCRGTRV